MKKFLLIFLAISVLTSSSYSKTKPKTGKDVLVQINPLDALMQGYYESNKTVGDFKSYGDFGIGTFNCVNGELIELDGIVYQALSDGSVVTPSDDVKIPFGATTRFKTTSSEKYEDVESFEALSQKLFSVINKENPNTFYAIKLHGTFNSIKVRSELSQKKPYRNLAEALKTDQREFVYENLTGTLVVMYNPRFMGQINTYGLHMHFISDDKTKGGHVLALSAKNLDAEFDRISNLKLIITDDEDFSQLNFSKDMTTVTKYAEFNK